MENTPEVRKIEIGPDTLRNLKIAGRWAMFISVIGFIVFGSIVMLGLITGAFLSIFNHSDQFPGVPDILLIGGFIALTLIVFFPILFLFRFSKHAGNTVITLSEREMLKTVRYLKLFFLFVGILLIILIVFYLTGLFYFGVPAGLIKSL